MRRLAGLDLRGWRDAAWRSWAIRDGEVVADDHLVEGPLGAVTVRRRDGRWIGGPQAALAPHGRGEGWGEVGRLPRLAWPDGGITTSGEAVGPRGGVARALDALAPAPDVAVLAIDDDGSVDEDMRADLLAALGQAGARRRELAWRPVLAVLAARETLSGADRVTVLCHGARGLAVQDLRIAPDGAPERRRPGTLVAEAAGLAALLARTQATLASRLIDARDVAACLGGRTARAVALGLDPEPELARRSNGDWIEVPRPPCPDVATFALDLPPDQPILLETCCEGPVAAALEAAVVGATRRAVIRLDPHAVARGALRAAERVAQGRPIFYDFLPMVRTLVRGVSGPEWFELVGRDELLPAGRVYSTRTPATFALHGGQAELRIYLDRTDDPPRRADRTVPRAGSDGARVSLALEQRPAAGRARLTLSSPAWPMPLEVDWNEAAVDERTAEAIQEAERRALPPPERMVLRAEPDSWRDDRPLALALRGTGEPDWKLLKAIVPRKHPSEHYIPTLGGELRPQYGYAVDSDGALPGGVPEDLRDRFADMLRSGAETVDRVVAGRIALPDGLVNTLTWTFRACPSSVRAHVADALDARQAQRGHPLLRASSRLLFQGLGRTVETEAEVFRGLALACAVPDCDWNANIHAMVGFLLARTPQGPRSLRRPDVERLARRAIGALDAIRADAAPNSLYYPPLVLGGLLRLREGNGEALDPDVDPLARDMLRSVRALVVRLEWRNLTEPSMAKRIDGLERLGREIEGAGGGAGLLAALID